MTKTARGKEINMAALIAANDTSVAVSNIPMNARGDILGPGGEIEVPAQEVQKEFYKEKLTAPKEEVKTLDDLEEKFSNLECYVMKDNLGYGKANNFGIKKSKTKYVFILNPDVILMK